MRWAARLGLLSGATVIAGAAVIAVRTVAAGSQQFAVAPVPGAIVDVPAAAERLAGAVRFPTLSRDEQPDANAEAFLGLHAWLARAFPAVHRTLTLEKVGRFSLLYTWPGSDPSLKPVMLMAHQDVVPIAPGSEPDWTHAPFSGDIADGFAWGRGSWDDKASLLAVLEALEMLVQSGAQPRRTVLRASGHDEEVGGVRGARAIAALLKARGTELDFVLDEGLIISDRSAQGIAAPVALIGIAEKGALTLSLVARAQPGHSSMPPADSAIGRLGAAVSRLEGQQMPARLAGVARQSLEAMGPEMSAFNRAVMANLWLSADLVEAWLMAQPVTNALVRTTTALTVIDGGNKSNVLPAQARALVNFRLLPGDTVAAVEAHVHDVIADPSIEVRTLGPGREPSAVSPTTSDGYTLINRTIRELFAGTVVAPGLVIAGTDSRHMGGLTSNIYRFAPIRVGPGDLERFHGTDERMSIANYAELVQFFHRLISLAGIDGH